MHTNQSFLYVGLISPTLTDIKTIKYNFSLWWIKCTLLTSLYIIVPDHLKTKVYLAQMARFNIFTCLVVLSLAMGAGMVRAHVHHIVKGETGWEQFFELGFKSSELMMFKVGDHLCKSTISCFFGWVSKLSPFRCQFRINHTC